MTLAGTNSYVNEVKADERKGGLVSILLGYYRVEDDPTSYHDLFLSGAAVFSDLDHGKRGLNL